MHVVRSVAAGIAVAGVVFAPAGIAAAQPVVEHDGRPSVKLPAGVFRLEGNYRWNEIPTKLVIPKEIGIVTLTLQGAVIESPAWDAEGNL